MAVKRAVKLRRPAPQGGDLVALVDVEIMAYQVCMECAVEERVNDDEFTWRVSMIDVLPTLVNRVESARSEVRAAVAVLAVGAKGNWRRRLCETYKANRNGKKKPLGYWAAIEGLRGLYRVEQWDWLEADDVLGILATEKFDIANLAYPIFLFVEAAFILFLIVFTKKSVVCKWGRGCQ